MSKSDDKTTGRNVSRRRFLQTAAIAGAAMSAPSIWTSRKAGAAQPGVIPTVKDPRFSVPVIEPRQIDKFIDPLPVPGGTNWPIIVAGSQTIRLVERSVQILPSTFGLSTTVWCYRGNAEYTSTFLGPTMLATSGTPNNVTYDYSAVPRQQWASPEERCRYGQCGRQARARHGSR